MTGSPLCEVLANLDNLNILENFVYGDTPEYEAIYKLLLMIKQQQHFIWEVKSTQLSTDLNIRPLPLSTLFVYLDMEGLIRPKYTYFEEYSFKYLTDTAYILNQFQGERREFLGALFGCCETKKTWTYVDIPRLLTRYQTDRQRVIAALEYFEEKGWIELQAKQAVDVYDIMTQAFEVDVVTEKLFTLFHTKETHEIQRIHRMVQFFESDTCLSYRLAGYFGERFAQENCGHCSVCQQGKVIIQRTVALPPLATIDVAALTREFMKTAGKHATPLNLTKFLCGIQTPVFTRLKIRSLPHFGALERYPFAEVKAAAAKLL